MTANCTSCSRPFSRSPSEAWRVLCKRCFVAKLKREGRYDPRYRRPSTVESIAPVRRLLTPDLIRMMIPMVHPDRHPPERAEQAHEATIALIAQRDLLNHR